MKKLWKRNKEDAKTIFWVAVTFACLFATCLIGD